MCRTFKAILFFTVLFVWTGCSFNSKENEIHKVGMLVEGIAQNNEWDQTGYIGLVQIGDRYNVDVFYRDQVTTEADVIKAVDELVNRGVNLIYGHSSTYGKYFATIASYYPDVHFIYFNGDYTRKNVTSINIDSHAMGFFAGMVAGKMTTTKTVGVIAAHEWQTEVEGFFEGVKYEDGNVNVHINYVNDWHDKVTATSMYERMLGKNTDVFYPAGDSFSTEIVQKATNNRKYAIGYVTDQSSIDQSKVLTSTIHHADRLYLITAHMFQMGELKGEKLTFDFQDEVISLGAFSDQVPNSFIEKVEEAVQIYQDTGLLPNEQ
ncbi:BMP family ABC transporter substrate-binding protein [Virgibacillus sp. W0430]|uniref:BMP family ABC transporter substrate-binding protein n=1 Tax=Virgibacillus sp. W0430 TaxID=3391580 RepID=UPI003F48D8A1